MRKYYVRVYVFFRVVDLQVLCTTRVWVLDKK